MNNFAAPENVSTPMCRRKALPFRAQTRRRERNLPLSHLGLHCDGHRLLDLGAFLDLFACLQDSLEVLVVQMILGRCSNRFMDAGGIRSDKASEARPGNSTFRTSWKARSQLYPRPGRLYHSYLDIFSIHLKNVFSETEVCWSTLNTLFPTQKYT